MRPIQGDEYRLWESKLSRSGRYRVADRPPGERRCVVAQWTGERRPPKAGEYYLSGSLIEAYRAPSDLGAPYHIARLMVVERLQPILRPWKEQGGTR